MILKNTDYIMGKREKRIIVTKREKKLQEEGKKKKRFTCTTWQLKHRQHYHLQKRFQE